MASIRQEILAQLCFMAGDKGKKLFAYTASEEQTKLERLSQPKEKILERIKRLAQFDRVSPLGEIHPGWILEKLGNETPRLLCVLKYFLGAEQVQYLRGHLTPQLRAIFNQGGEVSPEMLEVVRPIIEKKLGIAVARTLGGIFSLEHLGWMKVNDLKVVFRELGLEEIARAFSQVDTKVLRAFLSRFPVHLVQEIRNRMERLGPLPEAERSRAQAHLVAVPLDQIPANRLFEDIGFSVFARSLLTGGKNNFEMVCLRFRPSEGYRLKKVIEETSVHPDEARQRRQEILQQIVKLSNQGLIRKFWRPTEEPTVSERKVA